MNEGAGVSLLESLGRARWEVAHRTYGSSHSTLIGLLVDWWVRISPTRHSVLDGAPSCGRGSAGQGDALFCRDDRPVGVLEAEGTDPLAKIRTISRYLKSDRAELRSIQFGILLQYAYEPTGRGRDRQYPAAESSKVMAEVQKVSVKHPQNAIVVVTLDKEFSRFTDGVRSCSEYYSGTTNKVAGILFHGGAEVRRRPYFNAP
jgi:hypothetical protein